MWPDDTPTLPDPSRPGRPSASSRSRRPGAGFGRGARVGRYVVLQALGSGSTGCVYDAYDPELDRPVALKILADASPEGRRRLLREARVAARLRHSNVVTVYDAGVVEGRPYLAMERVRGVPLGRWLEASDRSLGEILAVFRQAAEGLQAAHDAGLVHQDFKPSNVMVDDDGRAVVVDFGLARPTSLGATATLDPWPLGGTPPYAAPEQKGGRVDARSDQYALCVSLTGALRTEEALDDLPAPSPSAPSMPRRLQRAVRQGLDAAPENRHPDLRPLISALQPSGFLRPFRLTKRRWAAAAVVTLGFALGSAAAYQASQPPHRKRIEAAEARLWTVWNPSRIERIHRAFQRSGHPRGQDVFTQARQRLSEHADAWLRELEAGASTDSTFAEATLRCLDRFLMRFDVMLDTMEDPDPRMVEHTVRRILDLEDPAACRENPQGLLPLEVPEDRPEIADAVRSIRRDLVLAEVTGSTRRFEQTLPILDAAVDRAGDLDWLPILAEARFWQARMYVHLERCEDARPILRRAARDAISTRHAEMAALSLTYLGRCAFTTDHELSEAQTWLRKAEPWLDELPERHEAASTWHSYQALLLRAEARPREAAVHHDLTLERDPAVTPLERGEVLNAIGISWYDQQRFEEAREAFLASLESYRAFYGEEGHYSMVRPLANLGNIEREEKRFDLALLHFQRALDILDAYVDQEEHVAAYLHAGIGMTLLDLQRPIESIPPLERAVETYSRQVAVSDRGGRSRFALARALWETRRDRRRALELAREAETNFRRSGPLWVDRADEVNAWISERVRES